MKIVNIALALGLLVATAAPVVANAASIGSDNNTVCVQGTKDAACIGTNEYRSSNSN